MEPAYFPNHVAPWVRCLSCSAPIVFMQEQLASYFRCVPLACPSCNASHDWWSVALSEIQNNFMLNQAFVLAGASTAIFKLNLIPGRRLTYRFSDYGIPKDAKILYANYTPGAGGLFPIELHGNVPMWRPVSNEVSVFPVPVGVGVEPAITNVNVMVSWVSSSINDESFQCLIEAFEAYSAGQYSSMVVPANVAVEVALSRLLTLFLKRYASGEKVGNFLENAATYGHQLNVVTPLISGMLKLPPVPEHLRGKLNRLRALRNQLAHSGALEKPLHAKEAAELICASLFGFHYVRLLRTLLE